MSAPRLYLLSGPVAWEQVYDGWYTYVKGPDPTHYFGVYDVVRCDTMWLDK